LPARTPPALHKITAPRPAKRSFPRTALFDLLDKARRDHAVVWVSAPAGSGKTTLLASYLGERRLPALWYHVDAGDGDIASFFYYLGDAAHRAAPRARLPRLTPEYLPGLATFTRNFFRELFGRLRRPGVLVFDNYQEAPGEAPLHETIALAADEAPEGVAFAVLSRGDPPAAFARLRAGRRLVTLGWDELRLTPAETEGIVRLYYQGKTPDSSPAALSEQLHATTDGWAAGVVLMLERVKTDSAIGRGLPDTLRQEAIFDYFAGEVFEKLDGATRDILLRSAFLPTMPVRLFAEMSELEGADHVLLELHKRNYFTVKHARDEAVYQYHPLFRSFLLTRASRTYPGPELLRIRETAAALLEKDGQIEAAVALYAEGGSWERLGRLVVAQAEKLIEAGRHQTLADWIGRFPAVWLERSPWLLYWYGMCRLPFTPAEARTHLEKSFGHFAQAGSGPGADLSWCGVIDTFIYSWGDFMPLDGWIARMRDLLAKRADPSPPDLAARVAFGMFTALMYRQPHDPQLPQLEESVRAILHNSPDPQARMMVGHHLLWYYSWWVGDFSMAALVVDALRGQARSSTIAPLTQIVWRSIEANYYWMTGAHEKCLVAVEAALEISRTTGTHVWDFMLFAQGVWGSLTGRDLTKAAGYLEQMAGAASHALLMNVCLYHDTAGILALRRGDPQDALSHGRTALAQAIKTGMPFAQAMTHLTTSRAHFERGEREAAAEHLANAARVGRQMHSRYIEFLCLLPEAEMAFAASDEKRGRDLLRRALRLSREQGLVNHLWFDPPRLARLYAMALDAGIETEQVHKLIRLYRFLPPASLADTERWPFPVKVYTLGRFSVLVDDKPLKFATKAQKKPLELLKALVAFGGREASEAKLAEALWPEAEGDAAFQAMATTLHRLRRLIGENTIERQEGRLSLDARYAWVDVWAFERNLGELEQACRKTEIGALETLTARLFELYRGGFLEGEPEASWPLSMRERLRSRFLRNLESAARIFANRQPERATACYQAALEVEPLAEALHLGLMRCYLSTNRKAEALAAYERCRKILVSQLGIPPSADLEALSRQARAG